MAVNLAAVDLSKSVFQLSLADANHHVIGRKRLNRAQFHRFLMQSAPVRLIMEACGTAHYWGYCQLSDIHTRRVKILMQLLDDSISAVHLSVLYD